MVYKLQYKSINGISMFSRARAFIRKTGLEYLLGFSLITLACARGDITENKDADGQAAEYSCVDNDHDNFYTTPQCSALIDCDDANPTTYPGATEFCDEEDNNCNGVADEEVKNIFYEDNDKDGFGDPARYILGCVPPVGTDPDNKKSYVENGTDCNDLDKNINPNSEEICDGIDNNCNDSLDEDLEPAFRICTAGVGQCLGFGLEYKTCLGTAGWSSEFSNCDALPSEPSPELCDLVDQDCDGNPYNGYNVNQFCYVGTGSCRTEGIYVCSPDGLFTLCSAVEGQPQEEICDGIDNNCDNLIDNVGPPVVLFADDDGDSFGDVNNPIQFSVCSSPSQGYVANSLDCDDTNPNIYITTNLYIDNDLDDYGAGEAAILCIGNDLPAGYSLSNTDCDDTNSSIYPLAYELCDGLDNDCNEIIDDPGCCELIDDFNRPNGGLGANLLGHPWLNTVNPGWTILDGEAYRVLGGFPDLTSSDIGYRDTFNFIVKFRFDSIGQGDGGTFMFGVNGSQSYLNGLVAKVAMGNLQTHGVRTATDVIEASQPQPISNNVNYLLRFSYDGSNLKLKLWEDGTAEPVNFLMEIATPNTNQNKKYMALTGDLDAGESSTDFVDYILDCN